MKSENSINFKAKLAAENIDKNDFHFKVPRNLIRLGIIEPNVEYDIEIIPSKI